MENLFTHQWMQLAKERQKETLDWIRSTQLIAVSTDGEKGSWWTRLLARFPGSPVVTEPVPCTCKL